MTQQFFFEDIKTSVGSIFILEQKEGICLILPSKDDKIKKIKEDLKPKKNLIFYKNIKKNLINYLNGKENLQNFPIVFLWGTPFQKQVWKKLTKITYGKKSNYSLIAQSMNKPKSQRAVGNAIGKNPIAFYIPCHRVIKKDGKLGGYAWGISVKKKLLNIEEMADSIC